jgi:hypothetical protein
VIYFFSRGREYVQCEIHWGRPHVLTVISPDGASRSERFTSTAHLTERWEELTDVMEDDGWMGPFGRDSRS